MNLPTKITITRIATTFILIATLFILSFLDFKAVTIAHTKINVVFLCVFVFFVAASYTDHLDGYLARKNKQVTDIGKFLDPVADKLLINSMVIFLVAPSIFAPYAGDSQIIVFNVWCAILLVIRDVVVDALRFIAAQKNVVIAANIYGKLKTVLEMIAISLVLLNDFPFNYFDYKWHEGLRITDFVVYITTFVSIISGVIYVWQNHGVFQGEKK